MGPGPGWRQNRFQTYWKEGVADGLMRIQRVKQKVTEILSPGHRGKQFNTVLSARDAEVGVHTAPALPQDKLVPSPLLP